SPRPERRDARYQGQPPALDHRRLPGSQLLIDYERSLDEIDMRIQLPRMQRRRNLLMPHLQQDLGQPRNPRRRFAMADVRFDRSDQAESGLLSILLKGFAQRRDFDRVAELGARAMGFDITDMARVGTGFRQRPADGGGLRLRVRNRVAVGLAALIEGAASNDAANLGAASLRIGESFQDDHPDPFSGNISVAALAEALAVAVAGDELPGAERQVFIGMNADVDASGDRQAGPPQFQILAGEVDGGQ